LAALSAVRSVAMKGMGAPDAVPRHRASALWTTERGKFREGGGALGAIGPLIEILVEDKKPIVKEK
jgi:hypothetical protein